MEPEHSQGRVHIVDDDASLRVAMGRRLTQAGYMVTTYATAQRLLDNLPTGDEPGCIILDVQMPGLAGPALQKRLGELGSTMPIIFLTAYADTRFVVQTLKAGALDFLTKPVASDDLLHAVEKAAQEHPSSITRSAGPAGRHSRPGRQADPARAAGFRPHHSRQHQQGHWPRAGLHRAHRQGTPAPRDGEDASPVLGRTGLAGRAGWSQRRPIADVIASSSRRARQRHGAKVLCLSSASRSQASFYYALSEQLNRDYPRLYKTLFSKN